MYIILINVSSTRIFPETPNTVECHMECHGIFYFKMPAIKKCQGE